MPLPIGREEPVAEAVEKRDQESGDETSFAGDRSETGCRNFQIHEFHHDPENQLYVMMELVRIGSDSGKQDG